MKVFIGQLAIIRLKGLIPPYTEVYNKPDSEVILRVWRQVGLAKRNILVIDPKDSPDDLQPKNSVILIFTSKASINSDWKKWLTKNSNLVTIKEFSELTKDSMETLLITGKLGFKLDLDAAKFVVETFATSGLNSKLKNLNIERFFSCVFTLDILKPESNAVINIELLTSIWPEVNLKNALEISNALGTPQALRVLVKKVSRQDSDSIFGLWAYLEIICSSRYNEYLHALHTYRNACDRLKYDYWEGLFLFLRQCYKQNIKLKSKGKEKQLWPSNSAMKNQSYILSSQQKLTPLQDLYHHCGIL